MAVDALKEFTEIRHLAAHGLMKIEFKDGVALLSFSKFTQIKAAGGGGTDFGISTVIMNAFQIKDVTQRLSVCAQHVMQTLGRAVIDADLPDLTEPDADWIAS